VNHRWWRTAVAAALVGLATGVAAQKAVNPRAAIVSEFTKRLDEDVKTRQKAMSAYAPLKQNASQAEIASREKTLGEAIRTARAAAKPGDIFAPDVAKLFREETKLDFRRRSAHRKQLRLDELPKFHPVVNQTYPPEWPLQTFPPTLLGNLPKLPPELEYRFVDNALILRDTKANIVVDFVLDVR